MALEAGADMVGFVFFPPSPRNLGFEAARALGERVRGRAQKVALSVDADDAELAAIVEALKPDLLQLHGKETPERVADGALALRAAGDEGAADRDARRPLADPALRQGRRPAAVRCARAARGDAAGRPRQDVRLAAAGRSRPRCAVHAVGRARRRQRRRGAAHHAGARRRRVLRRRARAGREGPRQDPRLHPGRAPGGGRTGSQRIASGA